jgi:hypothetical protein
MSRPTPVFEIQGRTVTLPVEVRDASAGMALYAVDAHVARRLLPGDEVDVVEPWPGRALLSVGCVDYRDNDLGDYDEIAIAFIVRERGQQREPSRLRGLLDLLRGRMATAIRRLPVNQSFTCEAGRRIWGFPKTVDDIEICSEGRRAVCTWAREGRPIFRFSLPRGGKRHMPERELATYTWIEGVAHRTRFTSGAEGMGVRLGGAELELGTHPIADELRALGLPRRALLTTWMEHMHGRFEAPEKL